MAYLEQELDQVKRPLSETLLLTNGETIFALVDRSTVIDTLKCGQMVFAIAIGDMWQEIEENVKDIESKTGERLLPDSLAS